MENSRVLWQQELEKAKLESNQDNIKHFTYLLATYSDKYFENLHGFFKTLPTDGDITLLILKGHLLIEQQVTKYVYNHFPNQQNLKEVFKDTHSLLQAGRAYCDPDCKETMSLWACFIKLNSIRNFIAHRLDQTGLEHKMEDFIKVSEQFISFYPDSDSAYDRMYSSINAIYQKALYLATIQEKKYKLYENERT
ncbi:hypothetical protein ACR30L_12040 [Psychromonas sp. PT13]|uniref:hypothetical protein n=1 Tax=Psychromonas sp. PT13 TaxID=3439547 RepID=UPI003EBC960E